MWVYTDEGANLSDSHKTPGHQSALARNKDGKLSQATMSAITKSEALRERVADGLVGAAVVLGIWGLSWVGKKTGERIKERRARAAASAATQEESAQEDSDELVNEVYAVIEDSKPVRRPQGQIDHVDDDVDDVDDESMRRSAGKRKPRTPGS